MTYVGKMRVIVVQGMTCGTVDQRSPSCWRFAPTEHLRLRVTTFGRHQFARYPRDGLLSARDTTGRPIQERKLHHAQSVIGHMVPR